MKALSFWMLVVRLAIVTACISQCSKGGSHAAVEVKASCVSACDHESHQTYRADSSAHLGQIIYETPWHGSVPSARVNREVRYGNAVHGKSGSTPDRAPSPALEGRKNSYIAERSWLTQDIGESALMQSDTSVLPAARSWGAKAGCFGGCVRRTAGLLQGGAAVARRAHNPKVEGAIPSPATVSAADAKTATFVVSNGCDQSRVAQQGQTGHGPRSQCSMARAVCTVDTLTAGETASSNGQERQRNSWVRPMLWSPLRTRNQGGSPWGSADHKNRTASVGRPACFVMQTGSASAQPASTFGVQMGERLELRPLSITGARKQVKLLHRHLPKVVGGLFASAVYVGDELAGVAMASEPKAPALRGRRIVESTRCATDGRKNACSKLYGALCRAAGSIGYTQARTYTRLDEPGTSLRAAGFVDDGLTREESWDRPSRKRGGELSQVRRWVRQLGVG